MGRPMPRKIRIDLLKNIVNEEINKIFINNFINEQSINEILDKPIPTEYENIKGNLSEKTGFLFNTYRFKTSNNYSYDVEFYFHVVDFNKIMLKNNNTLPNYQFDNATLGIIIGFTPTEIANNEPDDNIIGTIDDPYLKKTDRNEQLEVLGKIIYLVTEFMKNNPKFYVYIITKNTFKKNVLTYQHLFSKIFKNNFDEFEADDMFYYIKNNE